MNNSAAEEHKFVNPWTTPGSLTPVEPTKPLTPEDFKPFPKDKQVTTTKQSPIPQNPVWSAVWIVSVFLCLAIITTLMIYVIKKIIRTK